MTDLERLQAQEAQMEAAEDRRQEEIEQQILDLFQQLSPTAQADLLETLAEDEDIHDEDDDA